MPASFHGFLVLDKPGGMTSRDVVDRAQRWFPRGTRIGHTGTLDPLATGVLVIGVGTATRLTEYVQRMNKTYQAGLLLGARSDTDDVDGTVEHFGLDSPPPVRAEVESRLQEFIGEIDQIPPAFSAAKVAGRRAYALARNGKPVALEAHRVRIHRIDLLSYDYPHLNIEVHCGKGTYIRSLARDLGESLGRGAVVQTLRRTHVGSFSEAGAFRLDAEPTEVQAHLLPLAAALVGLPRVTLADDQIDRLRHGQAIFGLHVIEAAEVAVFNEAEVLAAVAAPDPIHQALRPIKVFPAA